MILWPLGVGYFAVGAPSPFAELWAVNEVGRHVDALLNG